MNIKAILRSIEARQKSGQTYGLRVNASSLGRVEIYFYGAIYDYGFPGDISARDFLGALDSAAGQDVLIYMNSPGGDVFEARAMQSAIERYRGRVTIQVDGLCASAATYLAMAADEVLMADGAFMMIHRAFSCVCGNAEELMASAAALELIDEAQIKTYMARTGQSPETIRALIDAETWMDADRAIEWKFADGKAVATAAPHADPAVQARFDLSIFKNPPQALREKPAAQLAVPAAQAEPTGPTRRDYELRLIP